MRTYLKMVSINLWSLILLCLYPQATISLSISIISACNPTLPIHSISRTVWTIINIFQDQIWVITAMSLPFTITNLPLFTQWVGSYICRPGKNHVIMDYNTHNFHCRGQKLFSTNKLYPLYSYSKWGRSKIINVQFGHYNLNCVCFQSANIYFKSNL